MINHKAYEPEALNAKAPAAAETESDTGYIVAMFIVGALFGIMFIVGIDRWAHLYN